MIYNSPSINIHFREHVKISTLDENVNRLTFVPDQVPWPPWISVKFHLFHGIQWKPCHAMASMEMESESMEFRGFHCHMEVAVEFTEFHGNLRDGPGQFTHMGKKKILNELWQK